MKTAFRTSSSKRPRARQQGNQYSNGLAWAIVGDQNLVGGPELGFATGSGTGPRLAAVEVPFPGFPQVAIQQFTGGNNWGPVTSRRVKDGSNPTAYQAFSYSMLFVANFALTGAGYFAGVQASDSAQYSTSTQYNWRWYVDTNGAWWLDCTYYNGSITQGANPNSGNGMMKTGWHVYGLVHRSPIDFEFYRDGDLISTTTSPNGGFGGPAIDMGGDGLLSLMCHSPANANNTYTTGLMAGAFGWMRALDGPEMAYLTANPGVLLGKTTTLGDVLPVPTVTHSMAATVETAATVGATLRKRARMAESVSAAATVSATPQARYRMQAAVSAEASITTALLTDAATTQAIAAEVAAAASVTATATVRRRVAANVGTITTVAALLGKRQRLEAFIFTQTTTSATMGRKHRLNAAISAAATTSATMRKKFLMAGTVEATAGVGGTLRVRRRLDIGVNTSTTVTAQVVGADALEPVIGNVRKVYLTTYVKKRNRMDRLELSSITAEYIDVIFVSKNNVDAFPVKMALSEIGEEPTEWTDAEWVDDENYHRGTKWFNTARCLAGGAGLNIDTPGEFQLWIKVEGPGDTPVKRAGTVAVS